MTKQQEIIEQVAWRLDLPYYQFASGTICIFRACERGIALPSRGRELAQVDVDGKVKIFYDVNGLYPLESSELEHPHDYSSIVEVLRIREILESGNISYVEVPSREDVVEYLKRDSKKISSLTDKVGRRL